RYLARDVDREGYGKRLMGRGSRLEIRKRRAVDVLLKDAEFAVDLFDVERLGNRTVRQADCDPRLATKARFLFVAPEVRLNALHYAEALRPSSPRRECDVDTAHPTGSRTLKQHVRSEPTIFGCVDGHRC